MAVEALLGFPEGLLISSPEWPETCKAGKPGDFRFFVNQGFGFAAPTIVTPYGSTPRENYYGFQETRAHPILNAPLTEPAGGTAYFDEVSSGNVLEGLVQALGIYSRLTNYAAFAASSGDPRGDRYLDQLRLVSGSTLQALFGATLEEPIKDQPFTIAQTISSFIGRQKEKWCSSPYTFSPTLAGTAGGDGDWAKESLAFGLHVENTYWGVYRVWSRPWLVTK